MLDRPGPAPLRPWQADVYGDALAGLQAVFAAAPTGEFAGVPVGELVRQVSDAGRG